MGKYNFDEILLASKSKGISIAKYCRENNLNYNSVMAGLHKRNQTNKIIKVMPIDDSFNTEQKSNDIIVEFYGATLKVSNKSELIGILEAIKNVQTTR